MEMGRIRFYPSCPFPDRNWKEVKILALEPAVKFVNLGSYPPIRLDLQKRLWLLGRIIKRCRIKDIPVNFVKVFKKGNFAFLARIEVMGEQQNSSYPIFAKIAWKDLGGILHLYGCSSGSPEAAFREKEPLSHPFEHVGMAIIEEALYHFYPKLKSPSRGLFFRERGRDVYQIWYFFNIETSRREIARLAGLFQRCIDLACRFGNLQVYDYNLAFEIMVTDYANSVGLPKPIFNGRSNSGASKNNLLKINSLKPYSIWPPPVFDSWGG